MLASLLLHLGGVLAVCSPATSHLPATLEALVPDYLPAVPRDPFAGQPFRYSAFTLFDHTTESYDQTTATAVPYHAPLIRGNSYRFKASSRDSSQRQAG